MPSTFGKDYNDEEVLVSPGLPIPEKLDDYGFKRFPRPWKVAQDGYWHLHDAEGTRILTVCSDHHPSAKVGDEEGHEREMILDAETTVFLAQVVNAHTELVQSLYKLQDALYGSSYAGKGVEHVRRLTPDQREALGAIVLEGLEAAKRTAEVEPYEPSVGDPWHPFPGHPEFEEYMGLTEQAKQEPNRSSSITVAISGGEYPVVNWESSPIEQTSLPPNGTVLVNSNDEPLTCEARIAVFEAVPAAISFCEEAIPRGLVVSLLLLRHLPAQMLARYTEPGMVWLQKSLPDSV